MGSDNSNLSASRLTRRDFNRVLAATAAAGAIGLPATRARAESTVTFLGWQGYDDPLAFDDFLKSKGITLNTTYIGNNDEIVAKLKGGGIGQIDIVTPYMGYIPLLAKLDLIQEIDVSRLPNLEKVMPIFLKDPNLNVNGRLYGVPFTWGGAPMVYDPAAIPTPPASWKDLLKPEFTGKVGMLDDPLGNMMIGSLVTTGSQTPAKINAAQLERSIDFLIEVKKQSRVVAASYGDLSDAIARGDVTITFNGWETMVKFCGDKGKVVKYNYPVERTNAWLDNYCIAKDAPNLDAAYELCNRAISVEGQTRLANVAFQAIVNVDAAAALPANIRSLYPYDDVANYGKKAGFFGMPPLEREGDFATFSEWMKAYERFKTA
ncbi:ABC transporter substrate-binding protein [Mesorhizobium caraganae]|uniref:ABC transporter substrate-binding protein n=1 Tax=Mesorhizobium caraganae TaxID=483206 RepID=UPI003ED055A9